MKKYIFLLLIFTLISCEKNETLETENVLKAENNSWSEIWTWENPQIERSQNSFPKEFQNDIDEMSILLNKDN